MKAKHAKITKKEATIKKLVTFFFIYFIFFTTYFSMITLSKYAGTSAGNGLATTAKWNVSIDTSDSSDTLNIVSGNITQSYKLKISSTSEVAANYSLILSGLPDNIEVSIDGGSYQKPVNNQIIFSNMGLFNANDSNTEHTHTLTFNAPLDADIPSVNEINIDVDFVQKQL